MTSGQEMESGSILTTLEPAWGWLTKVNLLKELVVEAKYN